MGRSKAQNKLCLVCWSVVKVKGHSQRQRRSDEGSLNLTEVGKQFEREKGSDSQCDLFKNVLTFLEEKPTAATSKDKGSLMATKNDNLSVCTGCKSMMKLAMETKSKSMEVGERVELLQMKILQELQEIQLYVDLFYLQMKKIEEVVEKNEEELLPNLGGGPCDKETKKELLNFRDKLVKVITDMRFLRDGVKKPEPLIPFQRQQPSPNSVAGGIKNKDLTPKKIDIDPTDVASTAAATKSLIEPIVNSLELSSIEKIVTTISSDEIKPVKGALPGEVVTISNGDSCEGLESSNHCTAADIPSDPLATQVSRKRKLTSYKSSDDSDTSNKEDDGLSSSSQKRSPKQHSRKKIAKINGSSVKDDNESESQTTDKDKMDVGGDNYTDGDYASTTCDLQNGEEGKTVETLSEKANTADQTKRDAISKVLKNFQAIFRGNHEKKTEVETEKADKGESQDRTGDYEKAKGEQTEQHEHPTIFDNTDRTALTVKDEKSASTVSEFEKEVFLCHLCDVRHDNEVEHVKHMEEEHMTEDDDSGDGEQLEEKVNEVLLESQQEMDRPENVNGKDLDDSVMTNKGNETELETNFKSPTKHSKDVGEGTKEVTTGNVAATGPKDDEVDQSIESIGNWMKTIIGVDIGGEATDIVVQQEISQEGEQLKENTTAESEMDTSNDVELFLVDDTTSEDILQE